MMINWSDVITWIEWSRDIMEELWSVWLRLAMNTCIWVWVHMGKPPYTLDCIWQTMRKGGLLYEKNRHTDIQYVFQHNMVFFSQACSSICKPLWLKCSRSNQNFSQKSIFGWSIQKWWADIPKMMIMEKRGGRKQRKKHVHEQHKKKVKTVTSRRNVIAWG